MAAREVAREDGIDVGRDRHPEPRPPPGRQGVPRGRHPRDLRQADDHHPRGRARSGRDRQAHGPRVRPDPQLHRLPDGARGARAGPGGRARHDPGGPGRVPAGLAHHAARGDRPEAGRLADRSGAVGGGAIGDIGSHAFNLAAFVSGLEAEQLCADLSTFVAGRRVDDNCNILLRYAGGARGMLWASQVAPGNDNALRIRVYGEQGRPRLASGVPGLPRAVPARPAAAEDRRAPTRAPARAPAA